MPSFNKILIANRGAIATRIIRTLDKMGIASLAVYAQSDLQSLHVQHATEAVSLGNGGPADTYLNIDKLLQIAREHHCDAVHPGYGFLSENSAFVQRCEAEGLAFIGPTSQQMELFGQKHLARQLAQETQVPLLPGSELLSSVDEAKQQAARIGYPVMLKSTAGGGGIGMRLCRDASELGDAFDSVQRLGASNFANDGVFLEKAVQKARHIEVQMFGDGKGHVLSIGERDCSAQRRNQKVIEECPAPGLDSNLRSALHDTAERLLTSISYRNAGTVEFLVDADSQKFFLLEVNTRLQVEHGVTEMVYGIDLVEWMVQQSASTLPDLQSLKSQLQASGHAIQMRLYAEDPHRHFQPCAGPLTQVCFPSGEGIRVDHWLESGIEVPADFDPMLAKLIAHAPTRKLALERLQHALDEVKLYGSETNLNYLRALCVDNTVSRAQITTRFLDTFIHHPARVDVISPGTLTTIQDLPGRSGYWSVGIPPSGPFDSLSFALGNQLLGNASFCAGLEITLHGPSLKFSTSTFVVVTGANVDVKLDDQAVDQWTVLHLNAGQTLSIGSLEQDGARAYLCVAGGLQCPKYLGSRSTFTLGKFGGHNGTALRTGDVLQLDAKHVLAADLEGHALPVQKRPFMSEHWQVRVIQGPHSAPDFFTDEDISMLFNTAWQVHYNSSRTGIRLIGPTPQWARTDGGEAGLHPSNIHDNAYAFGSIDFTGDMPVILGPDGPSLGGFVCPATVINADLWKLGQLRANDTVSFLEVGYDDAVKLDKQQQQDIACAGTSITPSGSPSDGSNTSYTSNIAGSAGSAGSAGILESSESSIGSMASESPVSSIPSDLSESSDFFQISSHLNPDTLSSAIITTRESDSIRAVYRAAGNRFLLIEYGDAVLSMESRFRVHALMQWIEEQHIAGVLELTPGIRSLQVHFDCHVLDRNDLLEQLVNAETYLDTIVDKVSIPSRIVHLPLSWDDEACQEAIERYQQSVREDAPWYPSNLEFIRRINGLESIDDVRKIVFDASYLVMGLGDVYLGAPVATPINPAHRLVTTKYNPARTWTAENSVGIGGSYLCVYGMEGPGGYQFVGRTLQMWNRYKTTDAFTKPWLLRFFDQIRFYEVSHDELMDIRQGFPNGSHTLTIEHTEISLAQLNCVKDEYQSQIQQFTTQRQAAFNDELEHWRATGQFNIDTKEPEPTVVQEDWPADCIVVESPVSGNLWQRCVAPGDTVVSEQPLVILESMKMEISINAPTAARVRDILFETGQRISAGQPLIILEAL